MGWWENRVLPHLVEASCGGAEIAGHRAEVCAGLEGRVLEIGFGSGPVINKPMAHLYSGRVVRRG